MFRLFVFIFMSLFAIRLEPVMVVSFLFDRFILFAFKFEALFVMVFELELNLLPFKSADNPTEKP